MANFPAMLLIALVAATGTTSKTIYFSSKLEPAAENGVDSWEDDLGVRTKLEQTLLKKLEEFHEKMKSPQPDLNLPTLDPFSAGHFNVNINRPDQMEVNGNITTVFVEGLSSFKVTRLKLYIVQSKGILRITLPQLKITSDYDLNGTASTISIPIYGRGNATLTLHNVNLEALPHFHIVDKRLAIKQLNLNWNPAARLEVTLDGLYCTSSELSAVVGRIFSDLTPRLLRNYKPILLKYADDILFRSINDLLAKLSLDDIIGLIPHNSITFIH